MTKFQHEWAAPATEIPEQNFPRALSYTEWRALYAVASVSTAPTEGRLTYLIRSHFDGIDVRQLMNKREQEVYDREKGRDFYRTSESKENQ